MRERYVDRLGFLPPALTPANAGQFLFRSTDVPRTRQSGQAFLVGLYPASYRIDNPILMLRTRDVDNMRVGASSCARLSTLLGSAYPKSDLLAQILEKNLAAVRSTGLKIETWNVDTDPKTKEEEESAAFWATLSASDNLFGRACHQKTLPEGVRLEDVTAMRDVFDEALAAASTFDRPRGEAARLAIGPFLKDIWTRIRMAANGDEAPRMALYSAHDTTLWPLLATLSQDNNVLIPYASHLAFELWRDRAGESWVAVYFNGTYLTVGDCPSSLCKLADFEAAIEKYVPVDYEQECKASG